MERSIGSLPRFDSIDAMVGEMDRAGVERVLVTQTKMWSYRRKWMYMDTRLDEVLQYTRAHPGRFTGLAGYNPFDIKGSLKEIGGRGGGCGLALAAEERARAASGPPRRTGRRTELRDGPG